MADLIGGLQLVHSEPLRLSRDETGTNDVSFLVSAGGVLTLAPVGLEVDITGDLVVSDDLTVTDTSTLTGNVAIGAAVIAGARLLLAAGAASYVPLQLTSGTLKTTPVAGAIEFLTDDFYATITTGAARKGFVLDDGARLTSGSIPVATTNGRLIDGIAISGGRIPYSALPTGGGTWANGGDLTLTGGGIIMPVNKKLALDGTGTKHYMIGEPGGATNTWDFYLNNVQTMRLDSNGITSYLDVVGKAIFGSVRASAGVAMRARLEADSFNRWKVLSDGETSWGPGGGADVDVYLYRDAAARLKIENDLHIRKSLTVGTTSGSGFGDIFQWATGKHYYDGGGDTYDHEASDNIKESVVGGTAILRLSATLANVQGALQCDSVTNDTGLAAGTYTPTRSAEANLDSNVTMTEAQYMRVGNTVTVSGRFTADPTLTATATSFEITLPVASNIGAAEDLAGTAFCGAIAGQGASIVGSVANNTAVFQWVAGDVTSQSWSYTFTYQVI